MLNKTSAWLSRNLKCAQIEADGPDSDSKKPKQMFVQWMTSDDRNFFPASDVVAKLPPGYYEMRTNMNGGLFFHKLSTGDEGLIKFPETNSDTVVKEIETFWEKEKSFRDAKLAYKRGILLYGPPGSGKTCTIKLVIANVVKRKGIVIRFSSAHVFESGMNMLREVQPETPVVVLMEDIDSILNHGYESDIINILDGVVPVDKLVFVATTNYPEKLGARIMNRPSRFDKRFEIGMPNNESREIYLDKLVGDKISKSDLDKWVKDTEGLSIAHLKELVVAVTILGNKYADAIKTLKDMRVKLYSDEFTDESGAKMAKASGPSFLTYEELRTRAANLSRQTRKG